MPDEPGLTLEQRERVCSEVLGWTQNKGISYLWSGPGDADDWACKPDFTGWEDFGLIVDAMRAKGFDYYGEVGQTGP